MSNTAYNNFRTSTAALALAREKEAIAELRDFTYVRSEGPLMLAPEPRGHFVPSYTKGFISTAQQEEFLMYHAGAAASVQRDYGRVVCYPLPVPVRVRRAGHRTTERILGI